MGEVLLRDKTTVSRACRWHHRSVRHPAGWAESETLQWEDWPVPRGHQRAYPTSLPGPALGGMQARPPASGEPAARPSPTCASGGATLQGDPTETQGIRG